MNNTNTSHFPKTRTAWTPIVSASLGCLILALHCAAAAEPITVLDWADAGAGRAPDRTFATGEMKWTATARVIVAGTETDPPTPFPNGEQGVVVRNNPNKEGKVRFDLISKPFSPEPAPASGWIEFHAVATSGFRIAFGAGGSPGSFLGKDAPYDGAQLLEVGLLPGDKAYVTSGIKPTARKVTLGEIIKKDTPFTFRVEWVATPDGVTFAFQVDGTPLNNKQGQPVSVAAPNPKQGTGVDYFRILSADVALGKITAASTQN